MAWRQLIQLYGQSVASYLNHLSHRLRSHHNWCWLKPSPSISELGLASIHDCESPWRRRTPGALCCRSGSPPIPARTSQRYSKRSPLTVLFRLQVQKYFLTRLWLILAGPMASATQQFPGSKEERGGGISRHEASTSNHKAPLMRSRCLRLNS